MSLNRRRYPTTQFVEYLIEDFITPTAVEHQVAKTLLKDVEESVVRYDDEHVDGLVTNGSSYKGTGYYSESSIPPSPEVRRAQELETTGEINDRFSLNRTPIVQGLIPTSNRSSHLTSRGSVESRLSMPKSLISQSPSSVFSPSFTSSVEKNRSNFPSENESRSAASATHSKTVMRGIPRSTSHSRNVQQTGNSLIRSVESRLSMPKSLFSASPSVFSPSFTSSVEKNRSDFPSENESRSAAATTHSKTVMRGIPRSTSHSRNVQQTGNSLIRGFNELSNARVVVSKLPGPSTSVQGKNSAGNSDRNLAQDHQQLASATTIVPQPTGNIINQVRRTRLPSENEEIAYRGKMLKLMSRAVQILEEQRNPKLVQERVVTENARYFEQVLKSNVKLPLTITSQIEDLNSSLINIEFSVVMCCVFIMRLKSITSRDQIAKSLMSAVLTKQLCAGVQWKKRGNDKRPMIGHMVNLIAVFAVIIKTVLEMNNQPDYPLSKLIPAIQQARRILAFESVNKDLEDEQNGDAAVQRADRQTQVEIDQRIGEIQEAIIKFRAPN